MPGDIRGFLQQYLQQQQQPNFSFGAPPGGVQPQPQAPPSYANPAMMGGQYSQLAQLLGTGQQGGGFLSSLLGNAVGMGNIGSLLGNHMQIPTPVTGGMQKAGMPFNRYPMGLLGYGGK